MGAATFDYGRDALDFLDTLQSMDDVGTLVTSVENKLRSYGYHAFLITGLPTSGGSLDPLVMLNGWPAGWFDLYRRESYVDVDPIAAHCKVTVDPFLWSEVKVDAVRRPRAAEVMHRATDFRMVHGLCVPIHGEEGFDAVVTMAGDRPDVSIKARAAIHLISIYTYAKASSLLGGPTNALTSKRLTTREREILTWYAVGKSTDQVGTVLGISPTTVTAHFENASAKLGTRGRTRTIVEAYRCREIVL